MPRYLLFSGDDACPRGGWGDFIASSNSYKELLEMSKQISLHEDHTNFIDIVDTETLQCVYHSKMKRWEELS